MTFREYISLIADSVAEAGYDQFHPSACVSNEAHEKLHVLEGDLSENGEEEVARCWAKSVATDSDTVFLAFRAGNRRVMVISMKGEVVGNKQIIRVEPYEQKPD